MTADSPGEPRSRLTRYAALLVAAMTLVACGEPAVDGVSATTQASEPERAPLTTLLAPLDTLERADARAVTVRIRAIGCGIGTGSGFVLDDRLLVTNRHVVEGASQVQVGTWDGHNLDVEVTGITHIADLAVVGLARPLPTAEFDGAARPIERLASDPLEPGDRVYASGFPGGGPFTVTEGEFIDEVHDEELDDGLGTLRTTAEVRPGNSGGPLLDSEGAVVGVVYAIEIATGYGLAVPLDALRKALDEPEVFEPVVGSC